MEPAKTKSLRNIEQKLSQLEPESMRYKVLDAAKNFKGSWLALGQYLYTAYKDKLYKEWGFMTFESYCLKEIGIRTQTAVKLLKSYYFVEKDEPDLVDSTPPYEAVNVLRLAKLNPNIDEESYNKLKSNVAEEQKDFTEVGKQFRSMIRIAKEQSNPEEEQHRVFQGKLRRIISTLKSIKQEVQIKNLLPSKLLKQVEDLIIALEDKLNEE